MVKKILTSFIAFLMAITTVFCAVGCEKTDNGATMSADEIFSAYTPAVVEVIASEKSGSAFVIETTDSEIVLATAYHVTGYDASRVKFRFYGEDTFVGGGSCIGYDLKHDLAFFTIAKGSISAKTVRALSTDLVKSGEKVYAIGNANGEGICITDGIVSVSEDIVKYGQSNYYKPLIRTTASVLGGMSGGILVSDSGKVVGMTVASDEVYQSLNYALPVQLIKTVYDKVKTNRQNEQVRYPSFSIIREDRNEGSSIKKVTEVTIKGSVFTFDGKLIDSVDNKSYSSINGRSFDSITSLVASIIAVDGDEVTLKGADGEKVL